MMAVLDQGGLDMADTGFKAAVAAIVVGGATALIGATTQPFWWCMVFTCTPKTDPTPAAAPPTPALSSPMPALTATPSKPHMGGLLMATNLQGADLNDGEIVANAEACRALCAADESCRAMTYVMPDTQHRENGHCWLKGGKPAPSPNDYMISAIKAAD